MTQMIIKDKFLLPEVFEPIFKIMTSSNFSWFYQKSQTINKEKKDDPYFSHIFYGDNTPRSNHYEDVISPILFTLSNVKSLLFVRANLYLKKDKVYSSCFHTDDCDDVNKYNHKTAIFYINKNDGYTEFESGEKVESLSNRLLIFDASLKHRAVSQVTEDRRIVININYIEK